MAPFTMQSLLLVVPSLLSIALAQSNITLNVPPYEPLGVVSPIIAEFYGPREVTIYNPNLLTGLRKRAVTKLVSQPSSGLASAVYTMANNPDGTNSINVVEAYPVFENGSLDISGLVRYVATPNSETKAARFTAAGSVYQDALDSQGSVAQAGSRVFNVNAGSGTFTQWAVNCSDPAQLIELGVVATNGAYPNTLAVAVENQIVCVGTTGEYAGIECYTYDVGFQTVNPPQYFTGTNVSLALPLPQAAGVPAGPPDTLSQLIFTDDENYLVAVVKGAANSDLEVTVPGFINVYPITSNGLGQPVRSEISGTKFLFGCTFLYDTYDLFCADAGVGTVYLSIDSSTLEVTLTQSTPAEEINPTSMNCWTARSPYSNGPFYASAVNEDYIAAFKQSSGDYITTHNFSNGNPNLIEMAPANSFVYGLTFGSADSSGVTAKPYITVAVDTTLAGGFQQQQLVELSGTSTSYEGMAVFVPSDESNVCDFN